VPPKGLAAAGSEREQYRSPQEIGKKQKFDEIHGRPAGSFTRRPCSLYVLLFRVETRWVWAVVESRKPVRLFFSVFPDPPAADRIAQIARRSRVAHGFTGQPLLTPRFHCSLYGFEDRDGSRFDIVAKAKEAAAIVSDPPFRVAFDCVKSFSGGPGNHPWVLVGDDGVVGLTFLHASLCRALREVGFRPKRCSGFTPHVTLLYDSRCIGEQLIEPICWTVNELVLVQSLDGQTKYIILARRALTTRTL
jgi:2'-5' RNA ligase